MDIKLHFDYMNKFFDLERNTPEYVAIVGALEGRDGEYIATSETGATESMPYKGDKFRRQLTYLFGNAIGTRLENIRADSSFQKALEKDPGLRDRLNSLSLRSTLHLGVKINKISPEDWEKGKRDKFAQTFQELVRDYITFREAYEKASIAA